MAHNDKASYSTAVAAGGRVLIVLLAFACCTALPQSAPPAPPEPPSAVPAPPDRAMPHGEILYLWPNGAPGAVSTEEQDKPHLEIFSGSGPAPDTAVIVCPGGGYTHLAYEKEGTSIAE